MLRQSSVLPEADGGEAGDSEDSDTEVEGEGEGEGHDSETETEPTRAGTNRFLKGKGKAISSLATTAVPEEPLKINTNVKGKFWALPTPSAKPNSASWTMFGESTPAAETDSYFGSGPSSSAVTPGISDSPQRPTLQSRASRSMVDLTPERPTKIELPKSPVNLEWAKPPPTPAGGAAGFFWSKKDGRSIGLVKRRRSADDLAAPPPEYELPGPGSLIPGPRDEEGKEKLPAYWCAVSTATVQADHRSISRVTCRARWSSLPPESNLETDRGENSISSYTARHCQSTASTRTSTHSNSNPPILYPASQSSKKERIFTSISQPSDGHQSLTGAADFLTHEEEAWI